MNNLHCERHMEGFLQSLNYNVDSICKSTVAILNLQYNSIRKLIEDVD